VRLLREAESRHVAVFVGSVSLTHLRLAPNHPLFGVVAAYQLERVTRLAMADA